MKKIEEKRKFIRLGVPVEIKYLNPAEANPVRRSATTKDISCDGLRFVSEQKINEGSALEMNLTIPGASNPVHVKGKTVWSKKTSSEDAAPFEVGFEFSEIEEDNKNTFLKYLCDILYGQTERMGYNKKQRSGQ